MNGGLPLNFSRIKDTQEVTTQLDAADETSSV